MSNSTSATGPQRAAWCNGVVWFSPVWRGEAPAANRSSVTAMRRSAGVSLAQTCHSGVLTSLLRPLTGSPRASNSRTVASSARAAARESGLPGDARVAPSTACISAAQVGYPYSRASCRCAVASFMSCALASRLACLRRCSRDGSAGNIRWGACGAGMMNPFLDCPVSADGQEKVSIGIGSVGCALSADGWPPIDQGQN